MYDLLVLDRFGWREVGDGAYDSGVSDAVRIIGLIVMVGF